MMCYVLTLAMEKMRQVSMDNMWEKFQKIQNFTISTINIFHLILIYLMHFFYLN